MTESQVDCVRKLESEMFKMPQVNIPAHHTIHGGVYTRTVLVPAGVLIAGVLIKIPTTLIVAGDCEAFVGEGCTRLTGYHVLTASPHRKQAFLAYTDTYLTMLFKTTATTVAEAEEEFTDESHILMSRKEDVANYITITGE